MKFAAVIVCRDGNEPLKPGNSVGYQCKFCAQRLQVSPTGLAFKAQHPDAQFTCNPCGLLYAEAARQQGKLQGVNMGPLAKEYFAKEASKGNPVAQWIRKHHLGESDE